VQENHLAGRRELCENPGADEVGAKRMIAVRHACMRLLATLFLACLMGVPLAAAAAAPPSWIAIDASGDGFVQESTGAAFVPWGFNYSRDERFRLIEDYWAEEGPEGWAKVERDFQAMKRLGANVVRINL
jgi:hypothetical protein